MNLKVKMDRSPSVDLIKIYGFIGVMGSGKGYKCNKLVEEQDFIQIDFADCLRGMAWKMLDWTPKNPEEYDLFKKGKIKLPYYGYINGRVMLQGLGSAMRDTDKDFWAKQWKRTVENAISMGYKNICCSDIRYDNEVQMIKSFSGKAEIKIEFCDYHSDRYDNTSKHESEKLAQDLLSKGYKDGDLL